jgi:LEM3 (ligand-effect modulator 3) family / CDC50 family
VRLAGTEVTIIVNNKYNSYGYGGEKWFVLSTLSWVGGKNNFLGIVYMVLAGLSFLTCVGFFGAYYLGLVRRRKFGDLSQLSWNT